MPCKFAILRLLNSPGSSQMYIKFFLALLILVAVSLMFFNTEKQSSNEPVTGLPWQIDKLADGTTRVFGITPGQTTLAAAMEQLGDAMDLAIIAAPHESGALEAYYSHYSAGPITGKLFLVLNLTPDELAPLRKRAFQDGGTRRYHLHPEDLPVTYQAAVKLINFMPSFNLDADIVQTRFGTPAEVIQVDAQQQHWLYPDQGLDLILNADGKEVLQYLSPRDFSAHRTALRQSPATGN